MKILFFITLLLITALLQGQTLNLPSIPEGAPNNYFKAGTADGGTLSAYNVFLRLHNGIAIGSPYVSDGQGGFLEKATLAIDGRTGNLNTMGNINGSNGVFSGTLGLGTVSPAAYFAGRVFEISDNRPIIRLSPVGEGGLATILFKGSYNSTQGSKDEFHFNYVSSQSNPKLVISGYNGADNSGSVVALSMLGNGNVGIGTETPSSKLSVNGSIRAKEVKVETSNWPDYVFKPAYKLPNLLSVKKYIDENQHLPGMPSAAQVVDQGLDLGQMNKILTRKVEELTLYLIDSQKQLQALKGQMDELERQVNHKSKRPNSEQNK